MSKITDGSRVPSRVPSPVRLSRFVESSMRATFRKLPSSGNKKARPFISPLFSRLSLLFNLWNISWEGKERKWIERVGQRCRSVKVRRDSVDESPYPPRTLIKSSPAFTTPKAGEFPSLDPFFLRSFHFLSSPSFSPLPSIAIIDLHRGDASNYSIGSALERQSLAHFHTSGYTQRNGKAERTTPRVSVTRIMRAIS